MLGTMCLFLNLSCSIAVARTFGFRFSLLEGTSFTAGQDLWWWWVAICLVLSSFVILSAAGRPWL